jgi:histidinol-phosphate aminotransferase
VPAYVPGEQPAPGRAVIKLNTNENPYPPSPRVLAALHSAIDANVRLYPDPEAGALRARAAALHGVPADHIMAGNGSDELIALVLRATIDPGARVAFPSRPTASRHACRGPGGEIVHVPWPPDFSLPPALAAARARVTFLCNPNSPSGTLVPRAEVELARALDGLLVVDEAYVDFAREHSLDLVGRLDNVIVLRTLSKSFSVAGLRIGLAFASPALLAGLRTVKDSYNLSRLALAAAEAALDDVTAMQANVARIVATRTRLVGALERLGFRVPRSEANFVLARRPGVDQAPVARALAARNILVRHFSTPTLEDALRITVGTDSEIDTLLAALAEIG